MMVEQDFNVLNTLVLTQEEQQVLLGRLYELLIKQVNKYNGLDSTSMASEKVQDILESLFYTLEVVVQSGISKDEILKGDINEIIKTGQTILKEKKKSVKVEWKLLFESIPHIQNVYFLTTVRNLAMFFEQYNLYYEAHDIPCSIDYWPICPMPDYLKGLSYIEEYISRIQVENDFLNCFDLQKLDLLYEKYMPGYKELLFNLCEPVLTNTVGLSLLKKDIRQLYISEVDRSKLFELLVGKDEMDIKIMIDNEIINVCKKIGMKGAYELSYFKQAVSGMYLRIYEALKNGDLSYVFIDFKEIVE